MCSQKARLQVRPADASLRTSGYVLDVSVDGFLQFLGGSRKSSAARLIKPQHRAALPVIDASRGGIRPNLE